MANRLDSMLPDRLMGIDLQRFGERRNSSALIADHEQSIRQQQTWKSNPGLYTVNIPIMATQKPAADFRRPPSTDACLPISIATLQLDTTHRGRVLRGSVTVAEPAVMQGVMVLLQDERGDLVRVSFYNMNPGGSWLERFASASRMFSKGRRVAIVEPYYKVMVDGLHGVRVDNPAEVVRLGSLGHFSGVRQEALVAHAAAVFHASLQVVFLDSLGPSGPAGHQDEGNALFRGSHYEDAAFSYGRALQLLLSGSHSQGLLISLLLNSAACHLALLQPALSLKLAFTAVVLDPSSSKAFFRAALALDALQLHGPANWCVKQAAKSAAASSSNGSSGSALAQEMAKKLSPAAAAATATAEQALSAICAALLLPDAQLLSSEDAGRVGRSGASRGEERSAVDASAGSIGGRCGGPGAGHAEAEAAVASAIKDQGNALFRSCSFADALGCYGLALSTLTHDRQRVATLLNNRATCFLRLGQLPSAVQDSSAALVVDPTQPKGYHRLASALMQTGQLDAALACITAGLVADPDNDGLAELQQRISTALTASNARRSGSGSAKRASSSAGGSSGGGSGGGTPGDRSGGGSSSFTQSAPGSMPEGAGQRKVSAGALSRMNDMNAMLSSFPGFDREKARSLGIPDTGLVDKRVPAFHTEFSMAGRWPPQCDIPRAQEFLLNAYENARGMSMQDVMVMSRGLEDEAPEYVLQRLGTNEEEAIHWLLTAPIGNIRVALRSGYTSASEHILHSFSNVIARKESLSAGTTHVAVGFLDLGNLSAALQLWPEEEEEAEDPPSASASAAAAAGRQRRASPHTPGGVSSSGGGGGGGGGRRQPLRWVGFDLSPYCVAKTMVISKMLTTGASVDALLQVWYSSAWSTATLECFRGALTAVLTGSLSKGTSGAGERRASSLPAEVQTLLQHWQLTDVSLAASRAQWLDSQKNTHAWIGSFKRKADRAAICSYLITGQLLDADVGSVVMFGIPAGFGTHAQDESFLQTIDFGELLSTLGQHHYLNVVTAAVKILRERVGRLQSCVVAGRVTLEVHLGHVQPSNTQLLARIRRLSPWTMSWSNVPDYLKPADFHEMARVCSAPADTIHYLHSMNWVRDVKGACFMDFKAGRPKEAWQQMLGLTLKVAREELLPETFAQFGWDKYLLCPPVDNPRNLIDLVLTGRSYQAWVESFFKGAVDNFERQVMIVQPPLYSATARTTSVIHITCTYDSSVNFVTAADPE
ncbi:MAG: hypothetical protein WDW36_005513 [Sanguina aurantia]